MRVSGVSPSLSISRMGFAGAILFLVFSALLVLNLSVSLRVFSLSHFEVFYR